MSPQQAWVQQQQQAQNYQRALQQQQMARGGAFSAPGPASRHGTHRAHAQAHAHYAPAPASGAAASVPVSPAQHAATQYYASAANPLAAQIAQMQQVQQAQLLFLRQMQMQQHVAMQSSAQRLAALVCPVPGGTPSAAPPTLSTPSAPSTPTRAVAAASAAPATPPAPAAPTAPTAPQSALLSASKRTGAAAAAAAAALAHPGLESPPAPLGASPPTTPVIAAAGTPTAEQQQAHARLVQQHYLQQQVHQNMMMRYQLQLQQQAVFVQQQHAASLQRAFNAQVGDALLRSQQRVRQQQQQQQQQRWSDEGVAADPRAPTGAAVFSPAGHAANAATPGAVNAAAAAAAPALDVQPDRPRVNLIVIGHLWQPLLIAKIAIAVAVMGQDADAGMRQVYAAAGVSFFLCVSIPPPSPLPVPPRGTWMYVPAPPLRSHHPRYSASSPSLLPALSADARTRRYHTGILKALWVITWALCCRRPPPFVGGVVRELNGAENRGANGPAGGGGAAAGVPPTPRGPPPPVPLIRGGIAPRRGGCLKEMINDVGYALVAFCFSLLPWWRPIEQRLPEAQVDGVAAPGDDAAPHAHGD